MKALTISEQIAFCQEMIQEAQSNEVKSYFQAVLKSLERIRIIDDQINPTEMTAIAVEEDPRIEVIVDTVCGYYDVTHPEIRNLTPEKGWTSHITKARRIAVHFIRSYYPYRRHPELGKYFNRKRESISRDEFWIRDQRGLDNALARQIRELGEIIDRKLAALRGQSAEHGSMEEPSPVN